MTDNTQLPADVIERLGKAAVEAGKKNEGRTYSYRLGYENGHFDCATEYATKLHQCDKANSALEEANRGLVEQNKEWKAKCARFEAALKDIHHRAEYGRPVDLALGQKSGEMCIAIEIISRTALEDGKANEAISGGGEKPSDKIAVLCHALAEEVGKDAETARAYLESEGVDMGKLEENARFVTWLAELAKLLHEAADGQPIKINQEEARKWFDDGMTPYQCFRETWNME